MLEFCSSYFSTSRPRLKLGYPIDGLPSNHGCPLLPFILLWQFEVRVPVGPPGKVVAVHAQELALPRFLTPTPRLHKPKPSRGSSSLCILSGQEFRIDLALNFHCLSEATMINVIICIFTCVKWCSLVFLLLQFRHSGKSSLRFHRPAHSSTVMIL